MVENANEGIVIAQHGQLKYLNPKILEISGYSEKELVSKPFLELVHPDDRTRVKRHHLKRIQGVERPYPYEFRIIRKQGAVRWLRNSAALVRWKGRPATLNCLSDITERRIHQQEKERAHQMQTLICALLRASVECVTLQQSLGRSLTHLVSVPWLALNSKGSIFLTEDDSDTLVLEASHGLTASMRKTCGRVPFGSCLCGRAAKSGEVQFADRIDGDQDHLYRGLSAHGAYCVPIKGSHGKVLGVINLPLREGHRRDQVQESFLTAAADILAGIIQRKRAQDALRESEQKYRTLFEQSSEGIGIARDGRVIAANQALINILGYKRFQEMAHIPLIDLISPTHKRMVRERMQKGRQGGSVPPRFDHRIVRSDGEERYLEVYATELLIRGEKHVLGTFRDITARKQAESRLEQIAQELRLEQDALKRKNIALREILDQIDAEKEALKRHLVTNVEQAIIPTLMRVRKKSSFSQRRTLDMLENDLREITSPFLDTVKRKYTKLTCRELEICRFVRDGMTSKEIADALHLSLYTVYKHREVIRRKLGLVNEGSNLRTHLQSL